jgi:gelsolin
MCTLGTAKVLDQGDGDDEHPDFWGYLGSGEIASAEAADEPITEFKPLLFRVDGDPEKPLEQVAKGAFKQRPGKLVRVLDRGSLNEDDVFLMDSGWEIFVWIGKSADTSEKIAAMGAADRYALQEPRAVDLPVTIVKSGMESDLFKSYFGM